MIISHRNSGAAKINALMNQVKVVLQGIVMSAQIVFLMGASSAIH